MSWLETALASNVMLLYAPSIVFVEIRTSVIRLVRPHRLHPAQQNQVEENVQ
jgi:hypothetical protein